MYYRQLSGMNHQREFADVELTQRVGVPSHGILLRQTMESVGTKLKGCEKPHLPLYYTSLCKATYASISEDKRYLRDAPLSIEDGDSIRSDLDRRSKGSQNFQNFPRRL